MQGLEPDRKIRLEDIALPEDSMGTLRVIRWAQLMERVERAYHQGAEHDLFKFLTPYIRRRARRFHHVSRQLIPVDELQGAFWEEVAICVVTYDAALGVPLLACIERRIKCRGVTEIRYVNARKRRPFFEAVSLDRLLALGWEPTDNDPSPEDRAAAAESYHALALLTDQERRAVVLRLNGHSYRDIALDLWPDKAPHSAPAIRMFERIRRKLSHALLTA